MASIRGKLLKYLRNHFTMLEMTYMTNGLYIWEMTYIFGKWLKYLRNG